jgi:5-methyltetrahydrofolate--homocysteine methyltransferase
MWGVEKNHIPNLKQSQLIKNILIAILDLKSKMINEKKPNCIFEELKNAIVTLDAEGAKKVTDKALESGVKPFDIINEGLSRGMKIVGEKWEKGEYFLPELLLAADAMNAAVEIVKPHLKAEKVRSAGKVVLGTVQGDIHDIGKNIVATMLTAAGFEVCDLGVDVPAEKFIEKAVETKAEIIGSSAFMTTTIRYQEEIEKKLRDMGLRDRFITIIGGVATSQRYADQIGADGWAPNAAGKYLKIGWQNLCKIFIFI